MPCFYPLKHADNQRGCTRMSLLQLIGSFSHFYDYAGCMLSQHHTVLIPNILLDWLW